MFVNDVTHPLITNKPQVEVEGVMANDSVKLTPSCASALSILKAMRFSEWSGHIG